ncbi:MAG: transcription elongation factor GreA, partial [Desulfovibrionales bacterium]|nr:transcription elongation factor GreA [Desulfovibrionales bacterium]
ALEQLPITTEGYKALKEELERLKTIDRPENIKAIEVARAHGDLSENAEYHAAKERQSFLEGRIGELSYKIGNAKIIDPETVPKDVVRFASRVLVENLDSEEEIEYMIVGPDEADIKKGKISVSSPLGSALIGKEPGDEAVLQAPGGKRVYEIIDIL